MTDNNAEQQRRLVHQLLQQEIERHGREQVQLLETHISWLLMSADTVYKLKKSLDLGFLNYSTLERRHHFCKEELRLNLRTAPELYRDVIAITGSMESPVIGGSGPALEYAVRMHRFPQHQLLDNLLHLDQLPPAVIDILAQTVATFHAQATHAPTDSSLGTAAVVHQPVQENFSQTLPRLSDPQHKLRLERLAQWADGQYQRLRHLMAERRVGGFVRECHGDLHLGNIVLLNGKPILFDGIEFSEPLHWVDVISDIAFLVMDLQARNRFDYACRFLNGYLEHTGDYAGLALLRYYLSYRAMVRAKVAAIRASQIEGDEVARNQHMAEFEAYLHQAEGYTQPLPAFIAITYGPSGVGKSFYSRQLLERLSVIRIRSDVERKRLFGLTPLAASGSAVGGGIYTAEASSRTYERLLELAGQICAGGLPVLVDATFLEHQHREEFRNLAEQLDVPFMILEFRAPVSELRRRITHRNVRARDASEADVNVLERQLSLMEPLSADERPTTISIDTEHPHASDTLTATVLQRLGVTG